jgi:hypothetical protein
MSVDRRSSDEGHSQVAEGEAAGAAMAAAAAQAAQGEPAGGSAGARAGQAAAAEPAGAATAAAAAQAAQGEPAGGSAGVGAGEAAAIEPAGGMAEEERAGLLQQIERLQQENHSLQQEKRSLRGALQRRTGRCVVCHDRACTMACKECYNLAFCDPCVRSVQAGQGKCPLCRSRDDPLQAVLIIMQD